MPGSLLFCIKSKKSVCYSVADNKYSVKQYQYAEEYYRIVEQMLGEEVLRNE